MVSFDTMVLVWGVKKTATTGQEHMIERTSRFLDDLKSRKVHVALTTPVVAEYLGDFSSEERPAELQSLLENFPILPFDLKAAEIAADLLYDKATIKSIQVEHGVSRQVLKADIAIIAASISAGANMLYSNDVKCRAAAQGKIIVKSIPDIGSETFDWLS